MPKFLEDKLKKEYPGNNNAVFGTLNKLGVMKGNKETARGTSMEKKHKVHALKKVFDTHGSQMDVINKHLK